MWKLNGLCMRAVRLIRLSGGREAAHPTGIATLQQQ